MKKKLLLSLCMSLVLLAGCGKQPEVPAETPSKNVVTTVVERGTGLEMTDKNAFPEDKPDEDLLESIYNEYKDDIIEEVPGKKYPTDFVYPENYIMNMNYESDVLVYSQEIGMFNGDFYISYASEDGKEIKYGRYGDYDLIITPYGENSGFFKAKKDTGLVTSEIIRGYCTAIQNLDFEKAELVIDDDSVYEYQIMGTDGYSNPVLYNIFIDQTTLLVYAVDFKGCVYNFSGSIYVKEQFSNPFDGYDLSQVTEVNANTVEDKYLNSVIDFFSEYDSSFVPNEDM